MDTSASSIKFSWHEFLYCIFLVCKRILALLLYENIFKKKSVLIKILNIIIDQCTLYDQCYIEDYCTNAQYVVQQYWFRLIKV